MGGQEPGITPGSPHNPQVLSESGGLWVPAYCSRRQTSTGALGSYKCRRLLESRQNEATNFQALLSNSEPSVTLTRVICGVKSRTRAGRARSHSRVLTLRTRRLLHCAWERCACLPGPQSDVGPAQTSAPALCPWWQRSPARGGGNVCAGVGREESRRLSYYFFVAHFHMAKITQKEAEAIPQVRPRPCREQRHVPAVAGTATCGGHRPRRAGRWSLRTAVTGPSPRSILGAGLDPPRAAAVVSCAPLSACLFIHEGAIGPTWSVRGV